MDSHNGGTGSPHLGDQPVGLPDSRPAGPRRTPAIGKVGFYLSLLPWLVLLLVLMLQPG